MSSLEVGFPWMLGTADGKHAIISAFDVGLCGEDMVDVSCDEAVDCGDDIWKGEGSSSRSYKLY